MKLHSHEVTEMMNIKMMLHDILALLNKQTKKQHNSHFQLLVLIKAVEKQKKA